MTARQNAEAAFRLLATGGYRCPQITDDIRDRWAKALPFEAQTVIKAAELWSGTFDRWPTLREFTHECQRLAKPVAALESPRAELTPEEFEDQRERLRAARDEARRILSEQTGPLFTGIKGKVV